MTWALCLTCGNKKFGAIVPCPKCGVGSCGDMNVDIAFSDHRLSEACLEALGGVIRQITPFAPDPADRFWSFMRYVSINHPSILRIELKPDAAKRCDDILAKASPAAVVIEKPARASAIEEQTRKSDGGAAAG